MAETSKRTFRRQSETEQVNVILAREGYLGTSPTAPVVAIAFQTLEAYRQLHRVCPRLSRQAQVRALCYLHAVRFSMIDLRTSPILFFSDSLPENLGRSIQYRLRSVPRYYRRYRLPRPCGSQARQRELANAQCVRALLVQARR